MGFEVRVIPVSSSMVLTLVAVLILYFGMKKLLHEPIMEFIQKRKDSINHDLENAKAVQSEAEALKLEYETKMEEAREESQSILAESRARGEEVRDDIIAEAKKEADSMKERARKEIEREKTAAFASVKSETAELALMMASRIMEKEMSVENQDRLVDEFIDEVGNTPWHN